MGGRVAVSHAYALGQVTTDIAKRVADALADAGVAIMTNAPGDRPFPPIGKRFLSNRWFLAPFNPGMESMAGAFVSEFLPTDTHVC
jgi:hypothetical protein